MKNKRRRTPTKTVLTAVVRATIGLVLHRPHYALLSAGFAYGIGYICTNSGDLSLFFTATKPTDAFPFYSTTSSVSIISFFLYI